MTGSRQADSIASLGNLKACPLAVRAELDGGYLAYLDFSDVFEPDGRQVEETFRNLARKEPSDKLSCPGWIGFFGYEFLAAHLGLSLRANRDLAIPDGWFGRPKTVIRLLPDATRVESEIPGRGREISDLLKKETQPARPPSLGPSPPFVATLSSASTKASSGKPARPYSTAKPIKSRFPNDSRPTQIDPVLAFQRLCLANPAPEAFFAQDGKLSIRLFPRNGNRTERRPYNDTPHRRHLPRKAGSSDGSVIESFLNDPKEVAEHNMLVDLRGTTFRQSANPEPLPSNGSGKWKATPICTTLFRRLGKLERRNRSPTLLKSMLPGGSITGCPKIAPWNGSTDSNLAFGARTRGALDRFPTTEAIRLNLIIRSMLVINDRCYAQAGGGIVVDSTPEYEYNENKIKAQALLIFWHDPSGRPSGFLHPQPRASPCRIGRVLVLDRRGINVGGLSRADLIVLSPGPGNPDQYPETQALCRAWMGKTDSRGVPRFPAHPPSGRGPHKQTVSSSRVETEIELIHLRQPTPVLTNLFGLPVTTPSGLTRQPSSELPGPSASAARSHPRYALVI